MGPSAQADLFTQLAHREADCPLRTSGLRAAGGGREGLGQAHREDLCAACILEVYQHWTVLEARRAV